MLRESYIAIGTCEKLSTAIPSATQAQARAVNESNATYSAPPIAAAIPPARRKTPGAALPPGAA